MGTKVQIVLRHGSYDGWVSLQGFPPETGGAADALLQPEGLPEREGHFASLRGRCCCVYLTVQYLCRPCSF